MLEDDGPGICGARRDLSRDAGILGFGTIQLFLSDRRLRLSPKAKSELTVNPPRGELTCAPPSFLLVSFASSCT